MKNCFDRVSKREAYKMTGISADDVRKRVARKLGDAAEEEERTRLRMKKRLILSVVLAALFLITAAAATSYHISKLAPGNLALVQDSIQTEPIKKTLGEFEITVLESLCDENYNYLALSVRGLTDKAKGILQNDGRGSWQVLFDVHVEGSKGAVGRSLMIFRKEESLCTEDTIYIVGELAYPNPEHKPVIVSLDDYFLKENYPGVTVTDTIIVPFEKKIGSSFTITPNQKLTAHEYVWSNSGMTITENSLKEIESEVTINKMTLSQLGLRIDYTDPAEGNSELDGCIFMQMKDGTIRTYNQLFYERTSAGSNGEDYGIRQNASFRELQDLKNFKAIILGNTAYPLDGGKPYTVTIDQKLQPFTLPVLHEEEENTSYIRQMELLKEAGKEYVWDAEKKILSIPAEEVTINYGKKDVVDFYPLEELCGKIGAEYKWDAVGKKAAITYNGRTLVLPVGISNQPIHGEDVTYEVELKLVDSKPYASWRVYMVLDMTSLSEGLNGRDTVSILVP